MAEPRPSLNAPLKIPASAPPHVAPVFSIWRKISSLWNDLQELSRVPKITIHLRASQAASNHPFYRELVQKAYEIYTARHPKFPVIRAWTMGLALCELPRHYNDYFMRIEAAARRNFKKAQRAGYAFKRIKYNEHLTEIREIWLSTQERQGLLPENMRQGKVMPISDPPSLNRFHDYPYFGIFKDNRLVAYAGCLVAGELCNLNDIYGHADFHTDGVVPMLIIEIAKYLMDTHPEVKYYSYGMYFGAGTTMRRFKRKFLFCPHRVSWGLE